MNRHHPPVYLLGAVEPRGTDMAKVQVGGMPAAIAQVIAFAR